MMTDFPSARKRQTADHVTAARAAMRILKPFIPRFEEWNQRAAMASAKALSHAASASERVREARKLAELYDEVKSTYQEFEAAVAEADPHSRIDDLRAAFTRLLSVLGRWRLPAQRP